MSKTNQENDRLQIFSENVRKHIAQYPRGANVSSCMKIRKAVFVFGSNLEGIHSKGAARYAYDFRGAEIGVASGRTGSCYALPTKRSVRKSTSEKMMPLKEIQENVQDFLAHAKANPETDFQVTRIGCGLSGFTEGQVAPLFDGAPANCLLPGTWRRRKDPTFMRLIICGSKGACMTTDEPNRRIFGLDDEKYEMAAEIIDKMTKKVGGNIQVVCGLDTGGDQIGDRWASERNLRVHGFPADWNHLDRAASISRNQEMSWYGTHLIAFTLGNTLGTRQMLGVAASDNLAVREVSVVGWDATQAPVKNLSRPVYDKHLAPSC